MLFLMDLPLGEPPHKDGCPVPDNLEHFSGRELRDIDFHVGISVVAGPPVESADGADHEQSGDVEPTSEQHSAEGVHLGSSDVCFVLVMGSVLVEPVIDVRLEINVVTKVAGPGRGGEELRLFGDQVSAIEFNIRPAVVLRDEPESCSVSCLK